MTSSLAHHPHVKWLHIIDIEELQRYESIWQSCIEYTDDPLFSSPPWINHWKEVFWHNKNLLHLFIAFDDDKCILFAPFYIQTLPTFPVIKQLAYLGQGELEVCEISSEYQDIILHPDYKYLLPTLASKIMELDFDQANFNAILEQANLLTLFLHIKDTTINMSGVRYSYLSEDGSTPKLSKNNKSKLNKCKNKLIALNATCNWVKEEDYDTYWELMSSFHQKRWTKLNKKGAFFHNKFYQFHKQFRHAFPQNIKMSAVVVNNQPIAIHYYFTFNKTLYFYQSGWDEENYANVSPGFALHIWSMKNCKRFFYDFMMGDSHNSYKAKLGCNHNSKMYNITLVRSKLKIMLAKLINKFFDK